MMPRDERYACRHSKCRTKSGHFSRDTSFKASILSFGPIFSIIIWHRNCINRLFRTRILRSDDRLELLFQNHAKIYG